MPVKIDIIILSYGKTEELQTVTKNGIESLLASEDSEKIQFDVLVIESEKSLAPYQYPNTRTIYPDVKFGYHTYMNIGINATKNEYICLCNNDLIYHPNWASEILKVMDTDPTLLSASPYCPTYHNGAGFDQDGPPLQGYKGYLGGWCIFVKREIFNIIGLLDENLVFWYCDADYCETLVKYGINNSLIPASKVSHIGSESLKTANYSDNQKLTQLPRIYYSYKWVHHSRIKYWLQTGLFKLKLALGL